MDETGVRYALAPDGTVAEPETALRLERAYRCFDCGEFVHLRRGPVRQAHFGHYAERAHPCNAETIAHEAAKCQLVAMLRSGVSELHLLIGCPGYLNVYKRPVACPEEGTTEHRLTVPPFDVADVEVSFLHYRLDAAASLRATVVLGLEVYHSHYVDELKRAALMTAGFPWVEVSAEVVLEQAMPWRVLSSSYGASQCARCQHREAIATAERLRQEELERLRAQQLAAWQAEMRAHRELEARAVSIARDGTKVVWARRQDLGKRFTCLVCGKPVTLQEIKREELSFMHAPGQTCDARRAWVRGGMLAVYNLLKRNPGQVRILRRCSGTAGRHGCKHVFEERLPAFDEVRGEEPSLLLLKDGRPVVQLVFGRNPRLVGAPLALELRPGKIVHRPTVWWQRQDGRLCEACTESSRQARAAAQAWREAFAAELMAKQQADLEARARRQARQAEPKPGKAREERDGAWLRRKVALRRQDPARTARAARFAKEYFAAFGVPVERVAEMGAAVRPCEHCGKVIALLNLLGLQGIPDGFERALGVYQSLRVKLLCNRCAYCGEMVTSAHHRVAKEQDLIFVLTEDMK